MAEVKTEREFVVTVSPHIRSETTVPRIMWSVSFALLPAMIMALYYFGPRALYVVALCIAGSIFSEWFVEKMASRPITITDGSAFLTGLLLGLNMPSSVPFYIPLISSFVAVAITKQLFGGLGYNVFNPALVGRAFALITWPRAMTTWFEPTAKFVAIDAKTTATPLGILKEEGMHKLLEEFGTKADLYWNLLIGHRAGSLGETSVIAILLGAGFLLAKRYITWHIPVSYILTVAVLSWVFGGKEGLFTGDPIIYILSGGLMLGAWFMATDYVTSPSTRKGQLIFGVGCGLLTVLIRFKAGYPEGVMFSILLMNTLTPLIDRNTKSRVFGARKEEAKK